MMTSQNYSVFGKAIRAFILLGFAAFAFDSHAQTVKLLRGPAYDIAIISDSLKIKIPVTIEKTAEPVRLQLVDVSFDNPTRTVSKESFTVFPETDTFRNSSIIINIKTKSPLPQGKYHLILNVFPTKPDTPETLTIDLTVKPATLSPIGTVNVSNASCFPFAPYKVTTIPLSVFETSGNAIVSPITIRPLSFVNAKGTSITANIDFTDPIPGIEAGKSIKLPYKVSGDLPIGVSTASFELNAPQLATPVTFQMSITTKRSGWWIVAIIVGGILFGYLIRTLLENLLQKSRAKKDALDLAVLLEEEISKRPDQQFTTAINLILQKVRNSLSLKKPAEIIAVTTASKTELTTAITSFNIRLQDAKTKVTTFSNALTGIFFLPKPIELVVSRARLEIGNINKLLVANSPEVAETSLGNLNTKTAGDLKTETEKIKRQYASAYTLMKESVLKVFTAQSPILASLTGLETAAAAISVANLEKDPANISTLLQLHSDQRSKTNRLFFDLALVIRSLLENINTTLFNGGVNLETEILAIRAKSDKFFNLQSDADLDSALASVEANMKEIQHDILRTMTAASLQLTTEQTKEIADMINKGQYADATNKLVEFKTPKEKKESGLAGDQPVVKESLFPITFLSPGRLKGFALDPLSIAGTTSIQQPIERTNSQILRTIFWTSLIQTILIGAGVTLFGYMLFQEKFTGTPADMIEVFSWAFMLDISLNTLTTMAGSVPKVIRS